MKNVYIINAQDAGMGAEIDLLAVLEAHSMKYAVKDLESPTCPLCGEKVAKKTRTVALFAEMVVALSRVYQYCIEKNSYVFTRKEIKERLLGDMGENVTARFGDWKLFGGLIYTPENEGKEKKGHYAFNIARTYDFLQGRLAIPTKLILHRDGREAEKLDYKTIQEIPKLSGMVDAKGRYVI